MVLSLTGCTEYKNEGGERVKLIVDGKRYGIILSFETDGCQIESVEDYDSSRREKIRYYFYSEETVKNLNDRIKDFKGSEEKVRKLE